MESLSYAFDGREPAFTDDIELQMDRFVRSRNLLKGWDIEPLPTLVTNTVDDTWILGPVLPDTTRKSVLSNQCLENSVEGANIDSGKSAPSTSTITLNSLAQSGRKISSSSINEKFARTRSEMKKLGTPRVSNGNQMSKENSGSSSPEPSVSAKRARFTNLQQQNPVCQVYGCNKDLSSSKDYHKRHKVCGIHSKTSIVIVNGIKQRFCQQCSRFHVLAEFDEDKRSCRKRLAGHNERRRKPQFDNRFGSTFSGTDLSSASMHFSEVFPGVFLGNGPTNYSRRTMIEKYAPNQSSSQLALQTKFDHSLLTSLVHPSRNCSNAPLSVKELSVGSNSTGALSLLSAQSQSSTNNSAGMSMAHPLVFEENQHGNQDFTMKSTSDFLTPSAFNSSGDVEGVSDANISVGFEIPQNKFVQESNSLKTFMSPEGANTLDLHQLSLHLQRVEHQKYSAQVKLENGVICHSTIS